MILSNYYILINWREHSYDEVHCLMEDIVLHSYEQKIFLRFLIESFFNLLD